MPKYIQNPKLAGANLIDCIPHTGECPLKCSECFYNSGRFFRTLDEPWMPSLEDVGDKIVRVNSGHDSNINRKMVIAATAQYPRAFYNTAIANFDFPAPVVFTANGGKNAKLKLAENPPENLMFVRVRVNSWELNIVKEAIDYYLKACGVPVVLTFMRYYDGLKIPAAYQNDYEWKKNLVNDYYCLKPEMIVSIMAHFKNTGVRMCGTPASSNCVDCRNCEFLYWEAMRRMGK